MWGNGLLRSIIQIWNYIVTSDFFIFSIKFLVFLYPTFSIRHRFGIVELNTITYFRLIRFDFAIVLFFISVAALFLQTLLFFTTYYLVILCWLGITKKKKKEYKFHWNHLKNNHGCQTKVKWKRNTIFIIFFLLKTCTYNDFFALS